MVGQKILDVLFARKKKSRTESRFINLKAVVSKFNRNRNHENWCNFKFKRNYSINLLRKKAKQYCKNLTVKNAMDNQTFWKSVKPYFSDKGSNSRRITLLENESILTDDKNIVKP